MIFVYTGSTKLSSTSWRLTSVHITTGLKPGLGLGLQFIRLAQEDYQIDFFQESSVSFIRNHFFSNGDS